MENERYCRYVGPAELSKVDHELIELIETLDTRGHDRGELGAVLEEVFRRIRADAAPGERSSVEAATARLKWISVTMTMTTPGRMEASASGADRHQTSTPARFTWPPEDTRPADDPLRGVDHADRSGFRLASTISGVKAATSLPAHRRAPGLPRSARIMPAHRCSK